ncbi:MAG TPA: LD-carboxypeptidase [Longimicrobiales bacterium]
MALVAPAGPIDQARLDNAVAMCASLGLEPVAGAAVLQRTGYLAGGDQARADDLRHALQDTSIDAVWALRGGYGTARLLPHLDFAHLATTPKAYIGFSDNTTIHLALARRHVVSFHAPHAGGDFPAFAEKSFRSVLFDGQSGVLATPPDAPLQSVQRGVAEGRLVGGNLSLLAAAAGTDIALRGDGVLLFIEEIEEPPYRIDRMLTQLLHSGALDGVAGIVIGQFSSCDDGAASALDVLSERLQPLGVPIVANAPLGHVPDNWTIPVGVRARLDAHDSPTLTTLESAVAELAA